MIQGSFRLVTKSFISRPSQFISITSRALSFAPSSTEEFVVFPQEHEGNISEVNWSLNEDGVVPAGVNAFRNARTPILFSKLGVKAAESVDVKFKLDGSAAILEAGDSISQEDFKGLLHEATEYLSSGIDLFVEDAVVGSHQQHQLGVRVITEQAVQALVARTALFPSPPREINHFARAKGWNLDPRFEPKHRVEWNGSQYVVNNEPGQGQRPIVVYAGKSEKTAVQFIEFQNEIVGANIVTGDTASAATLISAVGYAASIIFNEGPAQVLTLPSVSFVKGSTSFVVVNGSDEVVSAATSAGASLYGKYYNLLTADSLSTLFRGSVGSKTTNLADFKASDLPSLVSGNISTHLHIPDNQTFPAKKIIIFDSKAAKSGKLSTEDAVKALLAASQSNKENFIKSLIEKVEVHQINNVSEIAKLLA